MRTRRTAAVFQAEFPVPCRHTGSHRRTEWYRQDQSPASSCRLNAAAGRPNPLEKRTHQKAQRRVLEGSRLNRTPQRCE